MKKVKRKIFVRTFCAILAVYLMLMTGFSILMLYQQHKVEMHQFREKARYINKIAEDILQDNMDLTERMLVNTDLKSILIDRLASYIDDGIEIAVYTDDYGLLFNTKPYWLCYYYDYSKRKEKNGQIYSKAAYINIRDWFSEEDAQKLDYYLNYDSETEKEGDLVGYYISIKNFWVDGDMLIPGKIEISPGYAAADEEGSIVGKRYSFDNIITYEIKYNNDRNLPFIEREGNVWKDYSRNDNPKALREMVLDSERIKVAAEKGIAKEDLLTCERVNPITYRYYMPLPYRDNVDYSYKTKRYYSDFWTVVAYEANLLDSCVDTLAYVWVSCLAVFTVAGVIIACQTYKIYNERMEFEKYRSETTNALAHDLKTPLSIISGYAQNLLANIHTEKRNYYANNIYENVNRMDGIIKNMLELSRYETEMMQINNAEFMLKDICNELISRYRPLYDEKNISVSLEGDGIIKADPRLIERVVSNFMVNAIEHTPDGGEIKIIISPNHFEIYNSGSYISEDLIKDIWLPYKKVDPSRNNTKGSGLGLSIAARILDLYKFTYCAKNVDDGVVFIFEW